ncbi:MAG: hypothetical protein KUG79_10425 [Pseudomonadales bacterium]|nr:hypothetical protein [Pseudomonadales bacterium]
MNFSAIGWLCLMGAIGGFVHAARSEKGLTLPHFDGHHLKPGILGDIVIGMSGGLVIFLIVPADLDLFNMATQKTDKLIETLAVALIGGYGGPFILDRALGATIADMQQTMSAHEQQMNDQLSQDEADQQAIRLVDLQLSDTAQSVVPEKELIEAIKSASKMTRLTIRRHAAEKRKQVWNDNFRGRRQPSVGLMERTIPIFQALVDTATGTFQERCLSQLAYALKDQHIPDWPSTFNAIDLALKSIDSQRKIPHHYAYTWALAAIHAPEVSNAGSKHGADKIEQLLRLSLHHPPLAAGFEKELAGKVGLLVLPWLKQQNIDLTDMGIKLPPDADAVAVAVTAAEPRLTEETSG